MNARVASALLCALAAAGLSGCGDPALWARFRAERAEHRAARALERILIAPRLATDRDFQVARTAYTDLLRAFPPEVWTAPARLAHGRSREVAEAAGRAALALGRIAELEGDTDGALARYADARNAFAPLSAIALEAARASASWLEANGRTAAAGAAWADLARAFEPVDPGGHPQAVVLEAPERAAALSRELGRAAEADAVLRAAIARLEPRVFGAPDPPAALGEALGRYAAGTGDGRGALRAWRAALAGADAEASARIRRRIAERLLAEGHPDSALAEAQALLDSPDLETRLEARILAGRAFGAMGLVDSALAAFDDVADRHAHLVDPATRARFARGRLLETAGRWGEARTEYRALNAAFPVHPLGFEGLARVVEYHLRLGQVELAQIEGRRVITLLDRLIRTQRDLDVQFESRHLRAGMLVRIGSAAEAEEALTAFWRRYPRSAEGQDAALFAAVLRDSALERAEEAAALYRDVLERPVRDRIRARAEAALVRLEGESKE